VDYLSIRCFEQSINDVDCSLTADPDYSPARAAWGASNGADRVVGVE
jgi:hypothetical protein